MYCEHPITYAVQSGDNLFQLARRFKTTVQMILFLNPGVNPYNLQIGSSLIICPGEEYMPTIPDNNGENGNGEYPAPEIPDEYPHPDNPHPDKPWPDKPHPDKPHPDKPHPDKPHPDKPHPDKPHPDKPHPDKPHPDKPHPDKPHPDKPHPDKPHPDKPHPDKPWPDKPWPDKPWPDKPNPPCNSNRPCPPLPEIPKPDNGNGNGNEKPSMNCQKLIYLIGEMRKAWVQHVYWTRAVVVSTAEKLADQPNVVGRLMQNPYAIAKIFNEFFPIEKASAIERLVSEHLDIGGRLIIALRDGQMDEANQLNRRWYTNAEQLAATFAALSDYYDEKVLCEMLFAHLEGITRMAAYRLGGSYVDDINEFDIVEKGAIEMADYLSEGIIKEFADRF